MTTQLNSQLLSTLIVNHSFDIFSFHILCCFGLIGHMVTAVTM